MEPLSRYSRRTSRRRLRCRRCQHSEVPPHARVLSLAQPSLLTQAKLLSETLSPCCILFMTTIYVFTESSTVGTLTMTLYPVILWLTILAAASSALSASAAEAKARATTTEGFTNGLTCQKVIWACNSEDFWCEAFDVKLSAQMRAYITLKATAAYTAEAFRGSVDLFEVLHVCLLGSLVADGSLSSASFIALISLFGKMGADIQKIGKVSESRPRAPEPRGCVSALNCPLACVADFVFARRIWTRYSQQQARFIKLMPSSQTTTTTTPMSGARHQIQHLKLRSYLWSKWTSPSVPTVLLFSQASL